MLLCFNLFCSIGTLYDNNLNDWLIDWLIDWLTGCDIYWNIVRDADLELERHAGNGVAGLDARQPLYVREEIARRDLGVARLDRLDERVVDEDVLVLGLYHVVALWAQTRHVTVDVQRLLVFDALEHRVDDNHRPSPTHSRTTKHVRTSHSQSDAGS